MEIFEANSSSALGKRIMRSRMYSKSAIESRNHNEKNDFMSAELSEEEVPEEDPEEVLSCEEDLEEEEDEDLDEEVMEEEEEIEEEEVVDGERGEKGIEDVEEDEEKELSDVEEEEEEPSDDEEEDEEPVEDVEEDRVENPDVVVVEKEEEEDPEEEEGMEVEMGEKGDEKGIEEEEHLDEDPDEEVMEEEEEDPEEDPDEEVMVEEEEEDPEEDPEEIEDYIDVCNNSRFVEADSAFSNKKPKCNYVGAEQGKNFTAEANTHKEITKLSTQPEEITTELASGMFNKRKHNSCSVEAPINDSVFFIKRAKCNVDSAEEENDFAAGKSQKAMIADSTFAKEVTKSGNEIDEKILFVGALPMKFNDAKLKKLFLPFGPLCGATVLIGKEGRAKGCGFVHFDDLSNAERAMSSMNGHKLNGGSVLNVMIADTLPSDFVLNKIIHETILFVSSLPLAINDEKLKELFLPFGCLVFAYVLGWNIGCKRKRARVGFVNPSNAARALLSMNRFELDGKRLVVTMESCPLLPPPPLIRRADFMKPSPGRIDRKRIDVEGLPLNVDDNKLMELFMSFGPLSAEVYRDTEIGKSRCGHVRFESPTVAAQAVSLMNGFKLDGKKITVKIEGVMKPHCRRIKGKRKLMELNSSFGPVDAEQENANEVIPKRNSQTEEIYTDLAAGNSEKAMITDSAHVTEVTKSANEIDEKILFVSALPMDFDDDKLKELFLPFGSLCGATVLKDEEARFKGCGFVHFENPSNAERAMSSMNGHKLNGSVLNVMIADIPPSHFFLNKIIHKTILFVDPLPLAINCDKLKELFLPFGRVTFAYVVWRKRPKRKTARVGFANPSNAARALLSMNRFKLDGNLLLVTMESCPLLPPPLIIPRGTRIKKKRIYVEALPLDVDNNKLMELFSSFGPLDAKVHIDTETGKSKCCGHVRFKSASVAAQAVSLMNGFKLDGTEITVMKPPRRMTGRKRKYGEALPLNVDNNNIGPLDAKVHEYKETGKSICCGDVRLESCSSVAHAVSRMNGYKLDGTEITVKIEGVPPSYSLTSEDPHGVIDAVVLKDSTCKSEDSSTARAMPLKNDCKLDGGELSVQIAAGVPPLDSSCSESPDKVIDVVPNDRSVVDIKECSEVSSHTEEIYNDLAAGKLQRDMITDSALATEVTKSRNEIDEKILFVGALPMDFNDDKLKELFLPFGPLCGATVLKGKDGRARECGFVHFDDLSNAERAISSMNGHKLNGSVLNVMIADIPPSDFVLNNITHETILFVGSLPLAINEEKLKKLFLPFGGLMFAYFVKKKGGSKSKRACVGFANPSNAARALLSMNRFKMDGNVLLVRIESCPLLPPLDVAVMKDSTCKSKGLSTARAVPLMNDCKLDGGGLSVQIPAGVPPLESLDSEGPLKVIDIVVPKDQSVVDRKECSVRITNIPQSGSSGSKVIDDTILKGQSTRKRKRKGSTIAPDVSLMKYSKVDGRESSVTTTGIPPSSSSGSEIRPKLIDDAVLKDRNAGERNESCAAQAVSLTIDSKVDRRVPSVRITGIPPSGSPGSEGLHRVNDGTKIFVGQIPATFENDDLRELFLPFGSIVYANVMKDGDGKSKRCGFVRFTHSIFAARAGEMMNGHNVHDKKLVVSLASLDHGESSELLQMSARNQFASAPLALPPTYPYPSNAYFQHHTGNIIEYPPAYPPYPSNAYFQHHTGNVMEYPPAYPPYSWDNQPPVSNFWGQPQVPQFSNHYLCQESEGYLNPAPPAPGFLEGFGLHR